MYEGDGMSDSKEVRRFNQMLAGAPPQQRAEQYAALGQLALSTYDLVDCISVFIQHNSGITYRVDSADGQPQFLLKLHIPAGENATESAEVIQARMAWLEMVAQRGDLGLQMPHRDKLGNLVAEIEVEALPNPISCTVQRWLYGDPPSGDFTTAQITLVGEMIGELHQASSRLDPSVLANLPRQSVADLGKGVAQLHLAKEWDILSPAQFTCVEHAVQKITEIVQELGRDSALWGPVHGDLHHENILFSQNQAYPIDFDSLQMNYYLYDLGVTLYHIFYQPVDIRWAFLKGYMSVRHLPAHLHSYLEAFLTWAATENLAFQVTIPEERDAPLTARNLYQLTDELCAKLIADEPFVLV